MSKLDVIRLKEKVGPVPQGEETPYSRATYWVRNIGQINLLLSIIGAIFVWIIMGKTEIQFYSEFVDHIVTRYETNWMAIAVGFAILFEGFVVWAVLSFFAELGENIISIKNHSLIILRNVKKISA